MNYLKELAKPLKLEDADPGFGHVSDYQRSMFDIKLKDLEAYMDKHLIFYFYRIHGWAKVSTKPAGQRAIGGGSDVYICKNALKKATKNPDDLTDNIIPDYKCLAKFTILYPPGYYHLEGNVRNVKEFGEQKVRITWKSYHCHNYNDREGCEKDPLSPRARHLLTLAVQAHATMADVVHLQNQCFGHYTEIQKVKSEHVRYTKRMKVTNYAMKDNDIRTSLRKHAELIQTSGGLACFRDEFHIGADATQQSANTESGAYVWSFWFSTKWQRKLMKRSKYLFHLDSIHNTCSGLQKKEGVYLFTVVVKNQISGDGAPIAFMLSNSQNTFVISDFLKNLRDQGPFTPSQAVTGCDLAESKAIKEVYPEPPLVWCRFHVKQAFIAQTNDKIIEEHQKPAVVKAAVASFDAIIHSETVEEAAKNMEKFYEQFQKYPQFLDYVNKQWFDNQDYVFNAFNPIFIQGESTHNLIESYHKKLKWECITKYRKQRPDILVYQLLTMLVPEYTAKDQRKLQNLRPKVHNKTEKDAESKSDDFQPSKIKSMVFALGSGELEVESFTTAGLTYKVSLQYAGSRVTVCSCSSYRNTGSWCKHIFLAQKWWELMAPTDSLDKGDFRSESNVMLLEGSDFSEQEEQMDLYDNSDYRIEEFSNPQSESGSLRFVHYVPEGGSLEPTDHPNESSLENEGEFYEADIPELYSSEDESESHTDTYNEETGEGDMTQNSFTDANKKRKIEEMDLQLDVLAKKLKANFEATLKKCMEHGTKSDQLREMEAMLDRGEKQLQNIGSMSAVEMSRR